MMMMMIACDSSLIDTRRVKRCLIIIIIAEMVVSTLSLQVWLFNMGVAQWLEKLPVSNGVCCRL